MIVFDIISLNQKFIDVEDILFRLNHDNIHEVASNVATSLEMIVKILYPREDCLTVIPCLNDLTEIHRIVSTNTILMNNLIVNTTLQALKFSFLIIINNEEKYLTNLQKTHAVIKNLLVTVKGEKPDTTASSMAEIINYIRNDNVNKLIFFGDEENTHQNPEQKLRILVVDDELMHRTLMLKIVEPYGMCDTANNGEIALRMFDEAHDRGAPYHMITLDIMMPIMDGQQTLKMIRRRERERGIALGQEVTIFMVSSMDGDHILEAFFLGHCTDYIKKPYSQETILSKMRNNHLIAQPF